MATRTYEMESTTTGAYDDVRGVGWLAFAGVMLALAGMWNVFDGILALSKSKVYGANTVYVFSDLRTWGWIVLLVGCLELVAAFAIFSGSGLARWFGIGAAGVNALAQLAFVPVYPFWALMIFAADIIVIYALTVYGGQKALKSLTD
jgi:hypothetical protein